MCRCLTKFWTLIFAALLVAANSLPLPALSKSETVEVLKYFSPSAPKGYLNENQDRLVKKKAFKLNNVPDAEPVFNRENGLFIELPPGDVQQAEKLSSYTDINGISAVLTWRELQPAEDEYDWKPIDNLTEIAKRQKKLLILRISTAGVNKDGQSDTPDWVFADGAKSISYQGIDGKKKAMPLFWDTSYLAKWANFVKEMGKHCDGNPVFHSIGITGGGMCQGTMVVPQPEDIAEGKDGVEALEHKLTADYGMNQKQLVDHWKYVADLFPAAFSKTHLNFDIDPPIPDRAGQNALDEISDYLIYRYGQRVFLTHRNVADGKHGFDQYRVVIKFKADTFTGYELANAVSPEDLEKISHTALDDGASFMEVPEKLITSNDETVKQALSQLRSHMGYQILLNDVTIPKEIKPGGNVSTSFGFMNLGDSAAMCPERTFDKDIPASFKVALEFRNASNKLAALVLHTPSVPTTQWTGGKPIQWEESLKMPMLAAGKYSLALGLVNSNGRRHINFLNGLEGTDKTVVTNSVPLGSVEFK